MGKKSSDAPDYTPLANASKEAAQIMAGLGEKQLAFSEKMYNENSPLMKDIAIKQGQMMDQQMEQGKDYYDYQVDTFRPMEKSIIKFGNLTTINFHKLSLKSWNFIL